MIENIVNVEELPLNSDAVSLKDACADRNAMIYTLRMLHLNCL